MIGLRPAGKAAVVLAYLLVVTTTGARGVTAGAISPPPRGAGFSYQIGGAFAPAPGTAIVDRDRHDPPAPGAYGICYVNAFQAQPNQIGWWRRHHAALLLRRHGRPVIDRSWHEQLLDTSTPPKRRAIAAIEATWVRGCARDGYRAVEPDNLDSWQRSRGALTRTDNLGLAQLLVERAHGAGLAIAQKNTVEVAGAARRMGFDFAIAEECQPYHECDRYRRAYGDRVIEIEYLDNGGEASFQRACRLRGDQISLVLRDRDVRPSGRPGFLERRCR